MFQPQDTCPKTVNFLRRVCSPGKDFADYQHNLKLLNTALVHNSERPKEEVGRNAFSVIAESISESILNSGAAAEVFAPEDAIEMYEHLETERQLIAANSEALLKLFRDSDGDTRNGRRWHPSNDFRSNDIQPC